MLSGFGGGVIGGAVVRLVLDDSKLKSGLSSSQSKVQSYSKTSQSSLSKLSAVGVASFAVLAAAAIKFASASVTSALEAEAAQAELAAAIERFPQLAGESVDAFAEQASALQKLTGFSDEAILSADALLGRFRLTGDQIRDLNPLLLDFARAQKVEVGAAAEAVGKALMGQTRALKALGIEGFVPTGDRAADLATLMDLLKDKVGGAAEAFAGTNAGKIEIFKQQFDELQETIGGLIIPALGSIVSAMGPLLAILRVAGPHIGTIVTAFLAFKAFTFLPRLLLSIASGLEAVGSRAIAGRVLGAGAAIEGIGKSAGPVIGIIAGLTLGIKAVADAANQAAQTKFDRWLETDLVAGFESGRLGAEEFAASLIEGRDATRSFITQWGWLTPTTGLLKDPTVDADAFAQMVRSQLIPAIVDSRGEIDHSLISHEAWRRVVAAGADVGVDFELAVSDYARTQRNAADAAAAGAEAIGAVSGAAQGAIGTVAALTSRLEAEGTAHDQAAQYAAAHKREIASLRNHQMQLAGGILAVQGAGLAAQDAQFQMADTQAALNTLVQDGKRGTDEYARAMNDHQQAQLGAVESQLALKAAVTAYIGEQTNGNATAAQATELIRSFGARAGLTEGQVDGLVGSVHELIGANKNVPGQISTTYTTPGLSAATGAVAAYRNLIANIDRYVHVSVVTEYQRIGTGNVVGAQHGFEGMVRRPTLFMVAESGAEHVKVTPHGRLGGDGSGTGRGITVNFYGPVYGPEGLRTEFRRMLAAEARREVRV